MPDSATVPPAVAQNPDAMAALKKLTWSNVIAVASFAALAIAEALPQFIEAARPLIPPWLTWTVPLLVMAGNAVQGALVHYAKQDHKDAVVEALHTEPPLKRTTGMYSRP